jgi:hypothetical protein
MGKPGEPKPAKLFMSLIVPEADLFDQALQDLCLSFGEIDFVSERFPLHFTDYYTEEMGGPLFRHFITFQRLLPIPALPDIKQSTNLIETRYAHPNGDRRINIDPGYLSLAHIVLATTKGYAHRPYLREGIYADLTLIYRNKSFQPLDWTYPDYRQKEVIQLFNQFRKMYLDDWKRKELDPC